MTDVYFPVDVKYAGLQNIAGVGVGRFLLAGGGDQFRAAAGS